MPNKIFARFASVRLTLWLLLALAAAAAFGTFDLIPQGLLKVRYVERYGVFGNAIVGLGLDRFHTSIPFRLLVSALLLNLLACGLGKSGEGLANALGRGDASLKLPLGDRAKTLEALRAAGFTIQSESPLRAARRPWAFAAFGLVHLTPVLIVLGAFWGAQGGYIGTSNIHVGAVESSFLDWKTLENTDLPFAVNVVAFRREWYPLRLRLMMLAKGGGELGLVETREGERFRVPGTDFEAVIDRFLPDEREIEFSIFDSAGQVGRFSRGTMSSSPVMISPREFKGEVRQAVATLAFFDEDHKELGRFETSVNNPASLEGYRVFLTTWGEDESGKPYVGLQVTSDPGQWLLWSGALFFVLALPAILFVEGAWVAESEGALTGRSSRNRRRFAKFLGRVAGASG